MTTLQEAFNQMFGAMDFTTAAAVTTPVYQCPTCEDRGVIRYEVAVDDPRFGKLFACPNPGCPTRQRQIAERAERVGASPDWEAEYAGWTFDSFIDCVAARHAAVQADLPEKVRERGPHYQKHGAYAAARYWAEHIGQDWSLATATREIWKAKYPGKNADRLSHSLVLRGDVGLGKTGLAVAAVNIARAGGHAVVFARVQSIVRRIQETYSSGANELLDDVLRFYGEVPVLVIDEFGLEQYAPDRIEKFEEILRARDRKNLPFLLTTNLSLEDMYRLWRPRIADVVAKAHQVTIGGLKLRDTASSEEVIW